MPLFISSSNDRLPQFSWKKVWTTVTLFMILFITVWTSTWYSLGQPLGPKDTAALWSYHRRRAAREKDNVVVLTGSSQMRAGINLDLFAERTGKTPVQLAIDGQSPTLVLRDLAEDESFDETVIVEFTEYVIYVNENRTVLPEGVYNVEEWLKDYKRGQYADDLEVRLKTLTSYLFASPSFGRNTPDSLSNILTGRVFDRKFLAETAANSSHVTRFDRSSQINTETVPAEERKKQLIMQGAAWKKFEARPPVQEKFIEIVKRMEKDVRRIQSRGGKVVFLKLPISGEIAQLSEKYFPRKDYWDVLASTTGARIIHYADYPQTAAFECYDGSHLDRETAVLFTGELVKILDLRN